jgi:RimJ/RimL family protein N-acetyltransferase
MVAEKASEISVRPLAASEILLVVRYFHTADDAFLLGMGVDRAKLPAEKEWLERSSASLDKPDVEKEVFFVGWVKDGPLVGHSSINKIQFGDQAFIHLHLWKPELRRAGLGATFFKLSANYFMERFQLKRLFCEPYANNPAPNRVLSKLGFRFVKQHRIVPGLISFEQDVNRYELDHPLL